MKIDTLDADQFMLALADITEKAGAIKDSESAKALIEDLKAFRGSLADVPQEERNAETMDWAIGAIVRNIPSLCRENGDNLYGLLAALDGQTLDEYKACFTVGKLISDIKAAVSYCFENIKDVKVFLES